MGLLSRSPASFGARELTTPDHLASQFPSKETPIWGGAKSQRLQPYFTGSYYRSAGVWKASDILFGMRSALLILTFAAWKPGVTPLLAMIVHLPDAGEMVFGCLSNLVLGFWIYRYPNFFSQCCFGSGDSHRSARRMIRCACLLGRWYLSSEFWA